MFENLKQMKQLMGMMGNVDGMREQAEKIQEELARETVVGEAGAGAVKVTMNGQMRVVGVHVDPALLAGLTGDDAAGQAMAQDLIAMATNDGLRKNSSDHSRENGRCHGLRWFAW